MYFFIKWIKVNCVHSGKVIFQLFATIFFSVLSITVALLMIKSNRLLYVDEILADYGNYDVAFCQVDDSIKNKIENDARVDKIGYIYDLDEAYIVNGKGKIEVGCLRGNNTEKMYYVNPIKGRYPRNEQEICIDKVTLKENGFNDKLGENIELSIKGKKTNFTLVGIIEIQKQDSGEIYDTRYYPEQMYSVDNMKNISFPYAYIYQNKIEDYKSLHMLVDARGDESAFIDSYLQEGDSNDLHVATDRICGRKWAVLCLVGGETDGLNYTDIINNTFENEKQKYDGYTKYLVPILLSIIFVVSFIGIVDALRRDSTDKYNYYSLFMRLGLRSGKLVGYYCIEKLLVLLVAMGVGFGCGNGLYWLILKICNNKFNIYVPSVFNFDDYYAGYIDKMTMNPYIAAAVVIVSCVFIAAVIVSINLLKLKPVEIEHKSIRKVKRRKKIYDFSKLLNKYAWGENKFYRVLPGIIILLFMVTAVFGYQFFRCKSNDDTKEMKNQIEEARINGFDYYLQQNEDRYAGYTQYMHNTGVSVEQYDALMANKNVEKVLPVMEEYSTAICLGKNESKCNILEQQKYVKEKVGDDVNIDMEHKAELVALKHMGIDTKKDMLFHIPTVGIPMEELEKFCSKRLVAGNIDEEKIKNGEQIVLMISDQMVQDFFHIGEKINMKDVVRDKKYDESVEVLLGQIDLNSLSSQLKYSVESGGKKREYCCLDRLINYETRIGAIVLVDSYEDAIYFDSDNDSNMVNILTCTEAFVKWGLPNKNYNKLGVTLKNNDEIHLEKFESKWEELIGTLDYTKSTDVYSIVKQKQKVRRQIMMIFYAMLIMTTILSLLSIYNSIEMDLLSKEKHYRILRRLGMRKKQFACTVMKKYITTILVGIVMSTLAVGVYSAVVKYAKNVLSEAYHNNTIDVVLANKPWLDVLPKYNLLNIGMIFPLTFICGICIVLITGMIIRVIRKFERV